MDVMHRAARQYDRLIVAVGGNSSKKGFLTVEERLEALSVCIRGLENATVDRFSGLLVDYAAAQGATAIIRGLRATADFEYEFQMAMVNRRLSAEVETVFLMTNWEHSYLSSSIVKEVALLGGDYAPMVDAGVVPIVARALDRHRNGL